jgi:hypothetical protein
MIPQAAGEASTNRDQTAFPRLGYSNHRANSEMPVNTEDSPGIQVCGARIPVI